MANPDPEIDPETAAPYLKVLATEMNLAAARAIASIVTDDELSEESIIPSVFNRRAAAAQPSGTLRQSGPGYRTWARPERR